jgi:hypothetical protein
MKIKHIVLSLISIILTILGLLWFLQGSDILHLRPILCFANCEPIIGKSLPWQIIGTITFIIGILIAGKSIRSISQEN